METEKKGERMKKTLVKMSRNRPIGTPWRGVWISRYGFARS